MKKTLYLLSLVLSFGAYAQSGIHTKTPKATLQVNAKNTDGSTAEGIIAPRLTGAALHIADDNGVYGANQDGTLAFVTEPPIPEERVNQTSLIDSRGYYYFDAIENKWMKAKSVNLSTVGIRSLSCEQISFSNPNFIKGVPYTGTLSVPYTGGNNLAYQATSFTSNGLTFSLPQGVLNNESGTLVYTISGIPNISGPTFISINFAGSSCVKMINIATPIASIGSLNCNQAVFSPTPLSLGVSYTGTLSIPYSGGNGGSYAASSFSQNGLNFSLASGNLVTGNGTLVYTVNGTPTISGTFNIPITIANQSCNVPLSVTGEPMIDNLDCTDTQMIFAPSELYQGANYIGVFKIKYTGGNGAPYPAHSFTHNGLTFTLPAGNLVYGFGTLIYQVAGVPISSGEQNFSINFLGKSCTKSYTARVSAAVETLNCAAGAFAFSPNVFTKGSEYIGTLTVPYTRGNGEAYPASTFTYNGLTFSLPEGNLAGSVTAPANGNLVYNVTGIPTVGGRVTIPVKIFNKKCEKEINVVIPTGNIENFICNEAHFVPNVLSEGQEYIGKLRIPYTGSNGGSYLASEPIEHNGLTFTLVAGILDNNQGVLEYNVTGTPTTSGSTNFTLNFLEQSCDIPLTVTLPPYIESLECTAFEFSPEIFNMYTENTGTLKIYYTGGNGSAYSSEVLEINGLEFVLRAGTLANGSGYLEYDITGIPDNGGEVIDNSSLYTIGVRQENITFLGKTCSFTMSIKTPPIQGIICEDFTSKTVKVGPDSISIAGSFMFPSGKYPVLNQPIQPNTTLTVRYYKGNGSIYSAGAPITVGGLTFTLRAGTLTNNNENIGTLIYDVTGTPTQLSIKVPIDFYGVKCDYYIGLQDEEHIAVKGRIWKRHNLGADTTKPADIFSNDIIGNHYQWGRPDVFRTFNGSSFILASTNRTYPSIDSWSDEIRTENDPCPIGFKVPSIKDLEDVLSHSLVTNSNGRRLNLTNNSGLGLSFFKTGYLYDNNGSHNSNNNNGGTWSSTISSNTLAHRYFFWSGNQNILTSDMKEGLPIRCVSIPEN